MDPNTETRPPCGVTLHSRFKNRDEPMEPTEVDRYHLRYWSQCQGCEHTGPPRSDQNTAVEDGHDHAFPGWREMPVLLPRPYEGEAAVTRWQYDARRAYPHGWFERGGPVLTRRNRPSNRHVPGRAPGGGYDLARSGTTVRPKAAPAEGHGQQALFETPAA